MDRCDGGMVPWHQLFLPVERRKAKMEGAVYFRASWAVCFSTFVPGWVIVAILRSSAQPRGGILPLLL